MENKFQHWMLFLKEDPTDWILEHGPARARYFVLRDVLDKDNDDHEVRQAKNEIVEAGTVLRILSNISSQVRSHWRWVV